MAELRVPRKGRAGFARAIAHSHDAVEMDPLELAEVFRVLGLDVDAVLRHGGDRQRMNGLGWLGAGAPGLDPGAAQVTEKALRHLGAGAVVGADEEDARRRPALRPHRRPRRPIPFQGRMQFAPGVREQIREPIEVELVVDVTRVGGAPALADEGLLTEPAEVVGDQVRGLAKPRDELLDAETTSRSRPPRSCS
jgi:hypothetical protein